jgi:hypothetical protein
MPDQIQRTTEGKWFDVLNGIKLPSTHGYYATRLMSPEERAANMSCASSREAERQLFGKQLWLQVREQERLGTKNLSNALSAQLARMIANT